LENSVKAVSGRQQGHRPAFPRQEEFRPISGPDLSHQYVSGRLPAPRPVIGPEPGGGGQGSGANLTPDDGRWKRRLMLAMPIATVLLVAVFVGGRVSPARSVRVLPPTALTGEATTTDSVKFSWQNPTAGSAPDQYRIWRNGLLIGSVPANRTSFVVRGLIADTRYKFRVSAILGSRSSGRSHVLIMSTLRPRRSAAVLTGAWPSDAKIIQARPALAGSPLYVGLEWSSIWRFTQNCSVGLCGVKLSGDIKGYHGWLVPFTMTLKRSGYTYSGLIRTKVDVCPGQSAAPTPGTLKVKIVLTSDGLNGGMWSAMSWAGDIMIKNRPPKKDACPPSVIFGTLQALSRN
jgi:hypothetical protein